MLKMALDLASVSGIAWTLDDTVVYVSEVDLRGKPLSEVAIGVLEEVLGIATSHAIDNTCNIYIEAHDSFINAKTTRFLLKLIGYIEITLVSYGYNVKMSKIVSCRSKFPKLNTGSPRKIELRDLFNNEYGMSMTDNMTDALTILIAEEGLGYNSVIVEQKILS